MDQSGPNGTGLTEVGHSLTNGPNRLNQTELTKVDQVGPKWIEVDRIDEVD